MNIIRYWAEFLHIFLSLCCRGYPFCGIATCLNCFNLFFALNLHWRFESLFSFDILVCFLPFIKSNYMFIIFFSSKFLIFWIFWIFLIFWFLEFWKFFGFFWIFFIFLDFLNFLDFFFIFFYFFLFFFYLLIFFLF